LKCRFCSFELSNTFLDLGFAPPSNAYLTKAELSKPEKYYPLRVMVCDQCWLVQTEDYTKASELFDATYAYFSSTSKGWLEHASGYVEQIVKELKLGEQSQVIEIASNDGYLLKNFLAKRIPCLGIEPTASTAKAAKLLGIPVLEEFFTEELGQRLALEGLQADLIVGNNVYAHVPHINDFTLGLKAVLKPSGTITLEFPHLMRLIECNQFDTVYHEHFSYLSVYTVSKIFQAAGLRIWNVEELSTHGGSLRVYGCHDSDKRKTQPCVMSLVRNEVEFGLQELSTYVAFQERANRVKNDFLAFLIEQAKLGKKVAAYGAAAKGNTLLNYSGVRVDLLSFVADSNPAKIGRFLPGSHIPIVSEYELTVLKPDYVVVLPWNLRIEIAKQLEYISDWGGKFVTAVPNLVLE
jgi:hypothetical protein